MPYTDSPSTNPLDAVRALVSDTSTTAPMLTDNTIAFFLEEENNNVFRAAARAAEALAAKYANMAEERRVGPLWIRSFSDKSSKYLALAKTLWNRAMRAGSSGVYAGGISVTDKTEKVADSDRVRPAFSRRMMSSRLTAYANESGSSEDLLSPEELP